MSSQQGTSLTRLEALFPKEMFGCIIGEQGSRIKEVRMKNNVQINNDKDCSRGTFRAIRFEGEWCQMWNAFCEVVKTISEDSRAVQNADLNIDCFTIQIKIPRSIAGNLIGKSGQNLNDWRAKWPEVEFNVDEDPADAQYVRYFRMKGHPYHMCDASVNVADVIELALQKHGSSGGSFVPRSTIPMSSQPMAGVRRTGFDVPPGRRSDEMDEPEQKRRRVEGDIGSTPQTMNCTCHIMVDDAAASKIIGRQGAVIKGIRSASGIQVHTDKMGENPDGQRQIQLIGTLPGVHVALAMIQAQVLSGTN